MRKLWIILTTIVLGTLSASATFAQETCIAASQSNGEVASGTVLTWSSAFHCENVPDEGAYQFTVTVTNTDSAEAVSINEMALSHTTPRPRGQSPQATAVITGLPIVLAPGESQSFDVSGSYTLVETDEGNKANLHFRASGLVIDASEPFHLGINVMLRGEEAVESGGDNDGGPVGPPDWVPGPPPGAGGGDDDDDADDDPPDWVPGPPPWAGGGDDDDNGPPDWVPGPPPWAGGGDDDDNGPPDWVPGPPPWAGGGDDDDDGPPEWVPGPPPGGGPPAGRGG